MIFLADSTNTTTTARPIRTTAAVGLLALLTLTLSLSGQMDPPIVLDPNWQQYFGPAVIPGSSDSPLSIQTQSASPSSGSSYWSWWEVSVAQADDRHAQAHAHAFTWSSLSGANSGEHSAGATATFGIAEAWRYVPTVQTDPPSFRRRPWARTRADLSQDTSQTRITLTNALSEAYYGMVLQITATGLPPSQLAVGDGRTTETVSLGQMGVGGGPIPFFISIPLHTSQGSGVYPAPPVPPISNTGFVYTQHYFRTHAAAATAFARAKSINPGSMVTADGRVKGLYHSVAVLGSD
ncbi:MAG TPA: hypothetical protein ENK43_02260 [Planctomycetes bacterium]|nr:hypothetical protein [Planctomycetota bacterium]